jgi:Spy/CpxP family protein refolding chaperone
MKSTTLLIRSAVLCAALLLVSSPAIGQGKWWHSDEFKRELGLTQEQTRRLEEIFQKALPKLKTQKSALDEAEARFTRLLERGEDAAIMEQVNVVAAARSELEKARTVMLLEMKKILTGDQWAKFTALQKQAAARPARPADERTR